MSEKRFGYGETDLFEWVEDNGEMISTKECVNKLNELSEEKEYFERKKEYFLSKWSIVNAKNIQLRQEIKELKKENEKLQKENNDYEKQFRIINEKLDEYIKTADTYRIPISSLKCGDDLGYFNGVHQYMKKLKKDIEGGLDMSEKRFTVKSIKNNHYQIAENDLKMLSNEVVDLLNSLNEENEQLRQTVNSQQLTIANKQSIIKELFEQKGFCEEMAQNLKSENEQLEQKIKDKNEYQRVLEAKIRRLKDRIKVLEKNE